MGEGAIAIGGAIITAIGAAVGATIEIAGVMAVIAEVVGGAVIGAAIGGLTSAITGGSIGKGMLFGAIGGAVAGGIGAWVGNTGEVAGSAMDSMNVTYEGADGVVTGGSGSTVGISGEMAHGGGGLLSGSLGQASGGILAGAGSALINAGGNVMKGYSAEEISKDKMKFDSEQADKNRELQMKLTEMQVAGSAGSTDAMAEAHKYATDKQYALGTQQLAMQTDQFNQNVALTEASRARKANAVGSAVFARQGVLKGAPPPSIDQQVVAQNSTLYPTDPAVDPNKMVA